MMPRPLLGVMHVNLNCTRLARSLAFYRGLGLAPLSHTKPVPQDGEGFGISGQVQWDAHLLHDARGFEGPALDLLEWQQPTPTGRPPETLWQLGLSRLVFEVPTLPATDAPACALGDAWCARDPDGIWTEFATGAAETRLAAVVVNCRSLDASCRWYRDALGIAVRDAATEHRADGAPFGHAGPLRWREATLSADDPAARFGIRLVEWLDPQPTGAAAAHANQVGPYRMAFLVDDAHAWSAALRDAGHACTGPVWLDMGPEIPIDGSGRASSPIPTARASSSSSVPELPTG